MLACGYRSTMVFPAPRYEFSVSAPVPTHLIVIHVRLQALRARAGRRRLVRLKSVLKVPPTLSPKARHPAAAHARQKTREPPAPTCYLHTYRRNIGARFPQPTRQQTPVYNRHVNLHREERNQHAQI